jgi:hypothetical protein
MNGLYRFLGKAHGVFLRNEAQFGDLEGMVLGHGIFGAMEAIEHELAKEGEADFAGQFNMVFALGVDEVEVFPGFVAGDVEVFAEFQMCLRSRSQRCARRPRTPDRPG